MNKETIDIVKQLVEDGHITQEIASMYVPELKENEDEKIRKWLICTLKSLNSSPVQIDGAYEMMLPAIAWLEKQGKQKEINLVEILKHYPRETELYSPLYGKLWLAEIDEEREIITCYKHPLDEGCTRAILEQEDTVSFYSNGTTGLPDFSISKDCMLFLYDIKKQGEQKPADKVEPKFKVDDVIKPKDGGHEPWKIMQVDILDKKYRFKDGYVIHFSQEDNYELVEQKPWSEEDEKMLDDIIMCGERHCYLDAGNVAWLKSLKDRVQPQPKQEWKQENTCDLTDFENAMMHIGSSFFGQYAGLDPNDTNAIKEQANLLLESVPSKEWNEEDEETLDYIIAYIEKNKSKDKIYTKRTEVLEGMVEWLKSLKDRVQPQSHWKPSEEQLETLDYYIDADIFSNKDKKVLLGLYNDLKQL